MRFVGVALLALVAPLGVRAAPAPVSPPPESVVEDAVQLKARAVAAVGAAEIEGYVPYGWFSAIAYCPPETRTEWQCKSCQSESVKDFQVYQSGGDGGLIQYWYVGWWPSQQAVVVGRQGTDADKFESVLTDAAFLPVLLSGDQFPGRPLLATAHVGFLASHKRSAAPILNAVRAVMGARNATQIITVGHSLGGALAILDGLYLQLQLGPSATVRVRTLGAPRVGNDVFADFVNAKIPDVVRITNKRDIVPVLPPLLLGFKHSTGEKHINVDGVWNSCAGQDNLSPNCSAGEVLTKGVVLGDHAGPYAGGVVIGSAGC